jgi:hypothetical protein
MPFFYTCEVAVYSSSKMTNVWTEKKAGEDGDYLSSANDAPKGEGSASVASGTLRFDLVIEFDLIRSSHLPIPKLMAGGNSQLLLIEGILSDVLVYCGHKTFNCHKAILACHSEVFKAMVTAPFKEANENRIELMASKSRMSSKL